MYVEARTIYTAMWYLALNMYAPLQDYIYRKLAKLGKQDGKSDQPRPTMFQ